MNDIAPLAWKDLEFFPVQHEELEIEIVDSKEGPVWREVKQKI